MSKRGQKIIPIANAEVDQSFRGLYKLDNYLPEIQLSFSDLLTRQYPAFK